MDEEVFTLREADLHATLTVKQTIRTENNDPH